MHPDHFQRSVEVSGGLEGGGLESGHAAVPPYINSLIVVKGEPGNAAAFASTAAVRHEDAVFTRCMHE